MSAPPPAAPASHTNRVTTPGAFGRVAVVMGGSSAEREVSLDSGRNVLAALQSRSIDAHAIDGIPALLDALRAGHFARVFNILHGQNGGGEDGVLQGALESLHVPYTGSGVLGSALSMDKVRSKRVWQSLGLPTPRFVPLPRGGDVHAAAAQVGFPLIVKPACEGSSVGVTRVFAEADLDKAVALAAKYPGDLMVEQMIEGDELTVSILGEDVLPSIHIVPKGAFYDYDAKYVAEDTQYQCPGLHGAAEAELRTLSRTAFDALGCGGWGRVDVMRDGEGRNWLLEVNTAPGMTAHSLVPKAAAVAGMDYAELCWRILETSLAGDRGPGAGDRMDPAAADDGAQDRGHQAGRHGAEGRDFATADSAGRGLNLRDPGPGTRDPKSGASSHADGLRGATEPFGGSLHSDSIRPSLPAILESAPTGPGSRVPGPESARPTLSAIPAAAPTSRRSPVPGPAIARPTLSAPHNAAFAPTGPGSRVPGPEHARPTLSAIPAAAPTGPRSPVPSPHSTPGGAP